MSKDILSVEIDYDIDRVSILEQGPRALGSQMLRNEGHLQQSMSFEVSEATEKESSFTHQVGAELSVGAEFTAGVPFFAKGTWSVTVTASYSFTWGTVTRERREWKGSFPVNVGPNAMVEAVSTVTQSRADIPYKMTVRYMDGSNNVSNGIYRGVDQYLLTHTISRELSMVVQDGQQRNHRAGLNMEFFCARDNRNVILQKDFDNNNGVGLFDAVDLKLGNTCPHCHTQLRVADFRSFWFNQCTVRYVGVSADTEQIRQASANFSAEPGQFADLEQRWLSLKLNLTHYRDGRNLRGDPVPEHANG